MLNLSQRLILGCVLLATFTVDLAIAARHALIASGEWRLGLALTAASVVVCVEPLSWCCGRFTCWLAMRKALLKEILSTASTGTAMTTSHNRQRAESHCGALARSARQRGRPAADGVSTLRRRSAIHLRADHCDRCQGTRAESESGCGRDPGRSCRGSHGADDHARRREDTERHSRCGVDAKARGRRGDAALLPMRIGKQERSYRLRTTPMRDSEGRLLARSRRSKT